MEYSAQEEQANCQRHDLSNGPCVPDIIHTASQAQQIDARQQHNNLTGNRSAETIERITEGLTHRTTDNTDTPIFKRS